MGLGLAVGWGAVVGAGDVGDAGQVGGAGAVGGSATEVGAAVEERGGVGVSASPPHARATTRVRARTKNIPAGKLGLIRLHVLLIGNLLEQLLISGNQASGFDKRAGAAAGEAKATKRRCCVRAA